MGDKLSSNPTVFDNKFDADAKMKYWKPQDSYNNNKGFKAHEWYTKNSGDGYLSFWTTYWEEKGEGDNAYETGLKDALDYAIELAYKEQDKDRPNVIKMMSAAAQTLETFKQLLPEGSSLVAQIEKDVKSTLKSMGGEYLTNLYVNDFHKANTGKIFFSKTPIDPKTASESSFTNDFTVNDEIYAIAYFDATLIDLEIIEEENDGYDEATKTYKKKSVFNKYSNIKVDGSANMMQFVTGDWGEMGKQGYLTFALKPNLENADNQGAIEKFAKTIAEKSPRNHEIPIEFYFRSANSSGALTINLGGMNKEQILAEADKAVEKAKTELERSKVSSRGLPEWFSDASLYSHSFKPVSYAQVKALITKNLKAGYGAATIDALVVQDGSQNQTDWEVKVNAFGVPVSRSGPGYHVAYTGTDGKCYHYYFYIFQKYQGGGYGATTNGTPSGITPTQYNCDKKKFPK